MELIEFKDVYIDTTAVCAGNEEANGPFKSYFDKTYKDLRMKHKSFEKAEMKMLDDAIKMALKKTKINEHDIKFAISGDLSNQNVISNYTLRNYSYKAVGIYAAYATSCLGMILGGLLVEKTGENVICLTSSHNATSERQFRMPNEYGGAKGQTQTKTVTAACSIILTNKKKKIALKRAYIGQVIDLKQKKPDDMGRAMAPAAAESILRYLELTNTTPADYDLILTGDLSKYGSDLVLKVLEEKYHEVNNYNDCGLMIYGSDIKIYCGGSGCACLPTVSYSYIYTMMKLNKYKKVLLCATGALMNPIMTLQAESIPAICHIVEWEVENDFS